MRHHNKNTIFFTLLCAALLGACGGGTQAPEPGDTTVAFSAPGTDAPVVTPDVTSLGECGALPGQWMYHDLATGTEIGMMPSLPSTFQKNFRKSWGGTTTAYAVWEIQSDDMPVWNEGRVLHVGKDTPLTTTGMITSLALTGTPDTMVALVGTDRGLVIADIAKIKDTWTLVKQTLVDTVGEVRSVATNNLILEKNGAYVTMVYLVAQDAVLMTRLDDLRAGFGCMEVAYRAEDHPVDPKDPAKARTFRPIKVVAQASYAAFLTAARMPEEFANATQLQTLLQNEWLSFQSTAYLISLTRENPVMPFIMTMGKFDRFFASDIAAANSGIFFYGSRYAMTNPATVESGIASYTQFTGTPLVALWSGVPQNLGGDFRMGRFDTNLASAYIRGLDRAAKVDGFLSGPTQQKWLVWQTPLTLDYVRGVNFRLDGNGEMAVETPRYAPNGPLTLNWTTAKEVPTTYSAVKTIINATATDVDFQDVKNRVAHQHLQDDGRATFPLSTKPDNPDDPSPPDIPTNPFAPRLFHTGNLIFFVRHSNNGPYIYVYKDVVAGDVDISDTAGNPALLGFWVDNTGKFTKGISFSAKAVAAFDSASKASLSSFRIDDIREVSNTLVPQYRHFAMLIHSWDGLINIYRVVILQMDLTPIKPYDRAVEIQGCSDIPDPGNNYSNNVSYGKPDDQLRFMGPFQVSSGDNNTITYVGYFQHFSQTYNVWQASMTVTTEKPIEAQVKPAFCKSAGELMPITDPSASESLAATLSGNTFIGLHNSGLVRWKLDATTTQYLDVGANLLGGTVTVQQGQLWAIAGQYLTRMDTTDGFHPVALFTLDGASGESCPSCQFTDSAAAGALLLTAHPERGIELFEFTQ